MYQVQVEKIMQLPYRTRTERFSVVSIVLTCSLFQIIFILTIFYGFTQEYIFYSFIHAYNLRRWRVSKPTIYYLLNFAACIQIMKDRQRKYKGLVNWKEYDRRLSRHHINP